MELYSWSMRVATDFRKTCGVTHSKGDPARASRHCLRKLCGLRTVPVEDGNNMASGLGCSAVCLRRSVCTAKGGTCIVQKPAFVFGWSCRWAPRPFSMTTVPEMVMVGGSASRWTSCQRMAKTSPIRAPVARKISRTSSRSVARGRPWCVGSSCHLPMTVRSF